ncbi:helix-turn-helix domain-containing protein [Secundilactobacillus silagei]|uniref:Helix-turn-helix domain-containing protein n=1 Tax=Secundilactobacillus silagei JCM 19001 TaxID=1302250 RepID=A0A1Z5IGV6_9LACO|nr:helix-turn-helix domain-containing protein [Secundilactobacillus silagei]TDG73401.1 hypothetical protein C5L25_000550 [Secundilactobacillus silagei JCM 19001]GAX00772.1 hypothetical protein IWT126_00787 [Secundilactobacillus silagei JCM 19001]
MFDLNNHDIMSSSEAARRWHKADDYVRQAYRKTPWRFPEGTIRKFGKQLIVTRHGMEVVTGLTEEEAANDEHQFIPKTNRPIQNNYDKNAG